MTVDRARNWFFTWNNYSKDDIDYLLEYIGDNGYCFQEEIGESGTEHLQGVILFENARKFEILKKKFPKVHWEVARSKRHCVMYCSKLDTRNGDVYTNLDLEQYSKKKEKRVIKDPLEGLEYYNWQKFIIEDILDKDPDPRTIYWFHEDKGCRGKTQFCKHLALKYPNEVLYLSGSLKDCMYAVLKFHENKKNNLKICIFDFPRCVEDKVSYATLEKIKDGIAFSPKYESGMVIFDSPHVLCFANWTPDLTAMSLDRWYIAKI